VDAGYRVCYVTAADLVARCHRAAIEGRWATTMRSLATPRLLIIDELGYLPLQAEGAASLFQVIAQRYLKGSIALTPISTSCLCPPGVSQEGAGKCRSDRPGPGATSLIGQPGPGLLSTA
jgi:hypothetical protein